LRWWDGSDWTDHYRAPPTRVQQEITAKADELQRAASARTEAMATKVRQHAAAAATRAGADTDEIIAKVREAARSEVDRAARQIQPLISEYTNKTLRWLRIIAVIALILVVAWVVFQAVAQVSFFEWLGDRIDNLSE
jgi:hypothetical protein